MEEGMGSSLGQIAQRSGYTLTQPARREIIKIPSRDRERKIRVWVYAHPYLERSRRRPVLINWHGSGFTLGGFGLDHLWCAQASRELGIWVVDADYRKAPEDPFPAAVHDAEDVLRWVATRPDLFDLSRVAVSGFSSGATLALVAASVLRQEIPILDIKMPVAFYPITNSSIDPAHKQPPQRDRYTALPINTTRFFNACYLPNARDRTDPRASPEFIDPDSFPQVIMIVTAEYDCFAPEGNALANKLRDGRRTVINFMVEGVNHGFDKGSAPGSLAQQRRDDAYAVGITELQDVLDTGYLYFAPSNADVGHLRSLKDILAPR